MSTTTFSLFPNKKCDCNIGKSNANLYRIRGLLMADMLTVEPLVHSAYAYDSVRWNLSLRANPSVPSSFLWLRSTVQRTTDIRITGYKDHLYLPRTNTWTPFSYLYSSIARYEDPTLIRMNFTHAREIRRPFLQRTSDTFFLSQ